MGFFARVLSTVRVSLASSIAFATIGTTLVTIVIAPILEVLFTVLLGNDLGTPDLARTAYAATLVGMGLGVCSGIVSKAATDRNLGVFQEVHQYRRVDMAYWLGSSLMPAVLVLPTGLASLAVITVLSGKYDGLFLASIAVLVLGSLVVGVLLGVSMAGFGVALSDPYQGSSIASAIIPILAGVIVPTSLFPAWLGFISTFIPMSGIVKSLTLILEKNSYDLLPLVYDLGVGILWLIFGLAMVTFAVRRIRRGVKFSAM